ncbi:MAG: mechanosensitive ion channel family protein [Acutalibacteraceae bacterium]|nr:mechanosensitive ion channel family protein [Acutalibacteraceae bacterium]
MNINESEIYNAADILSKMLDGIMSVLPNIIFSAIIFLVGWNLAKYLTKIIMKFIERSKIDSSAEYFFRSFILVTFRILVILIVLSQLGIDVTTIVTAVGAATVTVGLALQDTLGNIASGILLIFTHPFKEGDYLKIGTDEGTVTKIALFSTHINTVDNKEIVIPNRNITAASVINYSSNEERRVDLTFNIAYDNDILKVKKIVKEVINNNEGINKDKEVIVGVFGQNDRCLTLDVKFWCKNQDYWDLYYKIQEEINIAFDSNKIKVPYQLIVNKQNSKTE